MKTISLGDYYSIVTDSSYCEEGKAFIGRLKQHLSRADSSEAEKDECMKYVTNYDAAELIEGLSLIGFSRIAQGEYCSDLGAKAAFISHNIRAKLTLLSWIQMRMEDHPIREEIRTALKRIFDIFPAM